MLVIALCTMRQGGVASSSSSYRNSILQRFCLSLFAMEEEDARRGFSGRRTASSSSSVFSRLGPRVQPYVPEPVHDPPLPGMIFGCTTETYQECMARQLFGLPERNRNQVLRVVPGSKLFLFNYKVKEMSGIFEATCHGGMNIVRDAFKGLFPAQVKIQCISVCPNLPASAFKQAIRENYFDTSKFKYELTTIQVGRLVELFRTKAEYVARYLSMVDCHYIHAPQNCQEPEYQKQPLHQPKHTRKRTAKEAIEDKTIVEMSRSVVDRGSTEAATSSHRSAEPITTVSALTLHQVPEAQELHKIAPPEPTKPWKETPPIKQNKKLADCSLKECDVETGTCTGTDIKLASDTSRHSMTAEGSQLLAGARQESVKCSALETNSKPIAFSMTTEVIPASTVKAVPICGLDTRQRQHQGEVSIGELSQNVQNDDLRNEEAIKLKNRDGSSMETDRHDDDKVLDPSARSFDKTKVILPDLNEVQMQPSLKVVVEEGEEGKLVEVVAVKLHNQDRNSQETGQLDMRHTTNAEEQKAIEEGKLDSVTSLPVQGFSLVFETITPVVVDKSECAEEVSSSGLWKRQRIKGDLADSITHQSVEEGDGLQTAEKVVVCACGDPQGFPAVEMTMDFGTCGHEAVHLASESEGGTKRSKRSLLVVGREQNLEDATIFARDVENKQEETEKRSASVQETFVANETTASGALVAASEHEVQDTVVSCGVINKQRGAVEAAVQLKAERAEGSQALEGADVSELSKSDVCLKLEGMECESEIQKLSMRVDSSSSVGGVEPQIVDDVVLELDCAQTCDGASRKEAAEDPAVAHVKAASSAHPDDNTDEVIDLALTMEEETAAKDPEVAAGNQAIGKRDRSIRDITPWKLLGRSL